jgi:CBS domain-containing protein
MCMSLKIEDIIAFWKMIKTVETVEAKATIIEAVTIMNEHEIDCLVIVKDERPVGIITERDMLTRVLLEAKDPETTKVSQIMSTPLVLGEPQMSIQDAVRLMVEKEIKKLPIIENGLLVGLITLTDLARSVAYLEHISSKLHNNAVE